MLDVQAGVFALSSFIRLTNVKSRDGKSEISTPKSPEHFMIFSTVLSPNMHKTHFKTHESWIRKCPICVTSKVGAIPMTWETFLVGCFNPSEKYWEILVSWDDDIPSWMESHKIPWFQTINQFQSLRIWFCLHIARNLMAENHIFPGTNRLPQKIALNPILRPTQVSDNVGCSCTSWYSISGWWYTYQPPQNWYDRMFSEYCRLVGGWALPLWKMEWKSVGMMKFPTEWKKTCSKPPTR
jgi:hypothetical protein